MNRLAAKISELKYGVKLIAAAFFVFFLFLFFVADTFLGGTASAFVLVLGAFVFILLLPVLKQAKIYGKMEKAEKKLQEAGIGAEERKKVKETLEDVL